MARVGPALAVCGLGVGAAVFGPGALLRIVIGGAGGLCALLCILVGLVLCFAPVQKPPAISELSPEAQAWHRAGKFATVYGRKMFYRIEECTAEALAGDAPTLILIHGFPSSSLEYHKALPLLREKARVVLFDHIGFGFSEKPKAWSYSIFEHADFALELWRQLGLKRCHICSHDMGDSVFAEILARLARRQLPPEFPPEFFASATFTNGGMVFELITRMLAQRDFMRRGPMLELRTVVPRRLSARMLRKLFGTAEASKAGGGDGDVAGDALRMVEMIAVGGGHLTPLMSMYYLTERGVHGTVGARWLTDLAAACRTLPHRIVWGDADPVANMAIARKLHELIGGELDIVAGGSHFLMTQQPRRWAEGITWWASA